MILVRTWTGELKGTASEELCTPSAIVDSNDDAKVEDKNDDDERGVWKSKRAPTKERPHGIGVGAMKHWNFN